jgi:DNA repair protein RecO (recombination protein O)
MEWRDEGVILSVRRHGETSAIVEVITAGHGRCLGIVRGGRSRRQRPVLQPGNRVQLTWRARLEEHLGSFSVEALSLKAGAIMEEQFRLAGLSTLAGLAQLLPEREAHRRIYDALLIILDAIEHDDIWPALLVRWELGLLDELGFGLDLSACASTGAKHDLVYVSPKTGRAVSAAAGEPYRERLLALPAFLISSGAAATLPDILAGFKLTGHFLARHVFEPRGINAPEQRQWVIHNLVKQQASAIEIIP